MSAIGDYIHLTAEGYSKYGIAKNDKYNGKATNLASSIDAQKTEIYNRLTDNTKNITNENVKTFEAILNTTKEELEKQKEDDNSIRAQLKKRLDNRFEETMGEIDWSTLNVSKKQEQKNSIPYARQNMKLSTIEEDVQQLNKILNELRSTDGISNIEEISQQITALNKQYKKLKNDIIKTDRGQTIASLLNNKKYDSEILLQNFEAFRKNLNTLISQYASMPAINLQKGDLFEHLIALAPLTAQEAAVNAIEGKIRKTGFVLGGQREKVEFNKQVFKNITKDFENGTLSTSRNAQGKIDVLLKWQGEDLKISAKNVNLQAYYIHILSGSSFLYMIQDLNGDFVNHFINVFSIQGKNKNSLSTKFTKEREMSMDAMKFILMYKALTGDNYQRKAANVFAVNDNSSSGKGSIKVYTMNQLIDKIESKGLYKKGITLNGKTTLNKDFKIKGNIKVKATKETEEYNTQAAKIRITNILSYLHSQKIHASLSTDAFKS